MSNLKIFKTPLQTAQGFGDYLFEQASNKEKFNVALSGGSTPKLLFNYLAEKYAKSDIWPKVHFFWGDERCVPPNDNDSNFKTANDLLLEKIDVPNQNIHRIFGEDIPANEAIRYGQEIDKYVAKKSGLPCFDLIILGMGDDGHTASIFPNQIEILKSVNMCEVAEHPVTGQKRITFTGTVINNAQQVVFLLTGENKKEKLAEIISKTGGWQSYPAAYINPQHKEVQWFVDRAAARLVK